MWSQCSVSFSRTYHELKYEQRKSGISYKVGKSGIPNEKFNLTIAVCFYTEAG
jgi:hypothetical protein